MTLSELVKEVATRTGLPRSTAKTVLVAALDIIWDTVHDGEHVTLPNFGVFTPKTSSPRALFNGTRTSGGKRIIKFRRSRRTPMDKYAVVIDEEKTKTAATTKTCPECGHPTDKATPNYCVNCGTRPFEKRPEKK